MIYTVFSCMMWSENPPPDTTYIQYLIQENKKNEITDFSVNEDTHLNKIAEEWTEILAVQNNIEKELPYCHLCR